MKKKLSIFIFIITILIPDITIAASEIVSLDEYYTMLCLRAKLLKPYTESNDTFNMMYDEDDQSLYISLHGMSNGKFAGQKDNESYSQFLDRQLADNADYIDNLPIERIYIISCCSKSRHPEWNNNEYITYLGTSQLYNVDYIEAVGSSGVVIDCFSVKDNYIKVIFYDTTNRSLTDDYYFQMALNRCPEWAEKYIQYSREH